jgi:hypothetical protein
MQTSIFIAKAKYNGPLACEATIAVQRPLYCGGTVSFFLGAGCVLGAGCASPTMPSAGFAFGFGLAFASAIDVSSDCRYFGALTYP